MRIFISGGSKSGKSALAQQLAAGQRQGGGRLYYIATMRPADSEDDRRVERHRLERRNLDFITAEQPQRIGELTSRLDLNSSLLLDSLTALLSNEMFAQWGVDMAATKRTEDELAALLDCFCNIVVVSDYIYSDGITYDICTENYRMGLAELDSCCVRHCDVVIEMCAGCPIIHKGEELFETLL